jgi:hypothetical protein
VFLPISTHFTAPPGIPLTFTSLKLTSIKDRSEVEPRDFIFDLISHLHTLYAQ